MPTDTHTDPYNLVRLPTEMWGVDQIHTYDKNTKVHTRPHIKKLMSSIATDGLFDALIVDQDGVIIAGHGRFAALVELGHKFIPVKHAAHLSKNQADAARIAHNKTASTDYDSGLLAEEMKRLMLADDVDISVLGFDEAELNFMIDDLGVMNFDAISVNLDEDIDNQDAETGDKVRATDASDEKVVKALGFNAIPIADVKHVRRFIADIESQTGKVGAEAFAEFCRER